MICFEKYYFLSKSIKSYLYTIDIKNYFNVSIKYNTISPYNKIKNLQSSTSLESQAEFLLDIPILLFKYIYQK